MKELGEEKIIFFKDSLAPWVLGVVLTDRTPNVIGGRGERGNGRRGKGEGEGGRGKLKEARRKRRRKDKKRGLEIEIGRTRIEKKG